MIISDDCSTDGTRSLLAAYEPRAKVHWQARNLGIGRNYQFLLEQCQTPLALLLNQDDLLMPDRLRRLKVREDEMTIFNGWVIDDTGMRERLIYRRPPFHATIQGVYRSLTDTSFLRSPSQAIFPVNPARHLGGFIINDAKGLGAEDWMCWLRLAAGGTRFRVRMRPAMSYRVHRANYSHQSGSHLTSKAAVRASFPAPPIHDRRLRVQW